MNRIGPEINPVIIIAIFIPVFTGMWLFVNFILHRKSWIYLQRNYHWQSPIPAQKLGIVSLRHRKINYNGMVRLYADMQGFYLKPFLLFGVFHKPLFIPWSDVRDIQSSRILFSKF